MDPIVGGIGGLVIIIAIFVIGGLIARGQNPPTAVPAPDGGSTDCEARCQLLRLRRAERCRAEADARRAQTQMEIQERELLAKLRARQNEGEGES